MSKTKRLILDKPQIAQIIRRIAYQMYENNMGAKKLAIVGIGEQGYELGGHFVAELALIDPKLKVIPVMVSIDKNQPNGTVQLQAKPNELKGLSVILVDDVLNTGKTMAYSLMALLEAEPAKIEMAVLVDRGHKNYPLSATFSGYQLATTLEEHIEVTLGKNPSVYLY
jgi:pyrimidine operon attenuation protein/uracil phosphoribosyltransferase